MYYYSKACGSKSYDHTYTDDTYRRTVGTLTVDLQYVRARFRICFVVDLCLDVQICQLNLSFGFVDVLRRHEH